MLTIEIDETRRELLPCRCGGDTYDPSGRCVICRMEDEDPDVYKEIGTYRQRSTDAQGDKKWAGPWYGCRSRKEAVKEAARAAGRATTLRNLKKRGLRILSMHRAGIRQHEIARELGIRQNSVFHWLQKFRAQGIIT